MPAARLVRGGSRMEDLVSWLQDAIKDSNAYLPGTTPPMGSANGSMVPGATIDNQIPSVAVNPTASTIDPKSPDQAPAALTDPTPSTTIFGKNGDETMSGKASMAS